MAEPQFGIHIFSLDEANALLPRVRESLRALRALRGRVVAAQARVDIEEMCSGPQAADQGRVDALLAEIETDVREFHAVSEALRCMGCELKDLDKGLIDFYGMRGEDVVYLCWMDGEERISHWHPLESGFKGRKTIDN